MLHRSITHPTLSMVLGLYVGTEADRSTVDYSLAGTTAAKIFNAMAALGIIAFTFGASLCRCTCQAGLVGIQRKQIAAVLLALAGNSSRC